MSRRKLNMRHFDVQLIGGMILHKGRISEMKTGEGKTLVATLAIYLNALEGKGAHLVTVNDYLAKRDAEWMGRVHRFLGLNVGVILSGLTPEERRASYAADITYGTNRSSVVAPAASWALNSAVLVRSSSSERALICGSISLMAATIGSNFLTSRSCWLPKTLVRIVLIIEVSLGCLGSGRPVPFGGAASAYNRESNRKIPEAAPAAGPEKRPALALGAARKRRPRRRRECRRGG